MAPAELGVPGQRGDGVLDARATRVVDTDDRAADHRHPLHQLGDFAAEHLTDRAAEDRLIVGEHPDRSAVDGAVPGDHAVAEERVGITGGAGHRTDLQKAAGIEQFVHAGPGAGDAALVTLGRRGLTAGFLGQFEFLAQFGQQFGGGPVGHCFSCT